VEGEEDEGKGAIVCLNQEKAEFSGRKNLRQSSWNS